MRGPLAVQFGTGDCGAPFNVNVAVANRLPVTELDPPCTYRGPASGAIKISAAACESAEFVAIAAPAAGGGVAAALGPGDAGADDAAADGDGDGMTATELARAEGVAVGASGAPGVRAGGAPAEPPPPHAHSALAVAAKTKLNGRSFTLMFSSVVVWEISGLCKGYHTPRVEV